jgi:hypothetical protein
MSSIALVGSRTIAEVQAFRSRSPGSEGRRRPSAPGREGNPPSSTTAMVTFSTCAALPRGERVDDLPDIRQERARLVLMRSALAPRPRREGTRRVEALKSRPRASIVRCHVIRIARSSAALQLPRHERPSVGPARLIRCRRGTGRSTSPVGAPRPRFRDSSITPHAQKLIHGKPMASQLLEPSFVLARRAQVACGVRGIAPGVEREVVHLDQGNLRERMSSPLSRTNESYASRGYGESPCGRQRQVHSDVALHPIGCQPTSPNPRKRQPTARTVARWCSPGWRNGILWPRLRRWAGSWAEPDSRRRTWRSAPRWRRRRRF